MNLKQNSLFAFLFVLITAVLASAQVILDTDKFCNDGVKRDYDNNGVPRVQHPGMPDTSCAFIASNIQFGQNLGTGNGASFFFDQEYQIMTKENGVEKPVGIRFFVYSDQPEYNSVQAIVQTAFATKARMSIIFVNPKLKIVAQGLHKKYQSCYENRVGGVLYTYNCPIQAITVLAD